MNIENLLMVTAASAMGFPSQRLQAVLNIDAIVDELQAFVDSHSNDALEDMVVDALTRAFPKYVK